MKEAEEIFEKHWIKRTGKPLDATTKEHMRYAIEAIEEGLNTELKNKYEVFESDYDNINIVHMKQKAEAIECLFIAMYRILTPHITPVEVELFINAKEGILGYLDRLIDKLYNKKNEA